MLSEIAAFGTQFKNAMDDDLNTADAISSLFDLVKYANTNISADSSLEIINAAESLLSELGSVLGLLGKPEEDLLSDEAKALIEKRNAARSEKNWTLADEIRDELKKLGVELSDTRQGTKVHIVK